MDGISITIVFELTNNASIGIIIRASVAILTSAACALSDGDLAWSRLPAVDHGGMVGKPCAEAVASHFDGVLHVYTLLCKRTYEQIESNRVHAQHLPHTPQLADWAGRLDERALEGR